MSANLPEIAERRLIVWGEPTVCDMGVCGTPFVRDGSVSGSVGRWIGGSAYATAIGASQLGARVELFGPVGTDEHGQEALATAREFNVAFQGVPAGRSRRTLVIVDTDGTRSMVGDGGDSYASPWADEVAPFSGGIAHVSLSSVVRDTTGAVERLLMRSDVEVLSMDLGSVGVIKAAGAERLARLASCTPRTLLFANADETAAVREVCGGDLDVWGFVSREGSLGATALIDGVSEFEPAIQGVTVKDTTGAGDAFAAGFLASWLVSGGSVKDALRSAHAHAALVVSQVGTIATEH